MSADYSVDRCQRLAEVVSEFILRFHGLEDSGRMNTEALIEQMAVRTVSVLLRHQSGDETATDP